MASFPVGRGTIDNSICEGRLTLTSGTPVTTTDVTGATSVYFTPFRGNRIALYDGSSSWSILTFSELTLALGTVTSGLPYDVFAYDNGGTVALEKLAWTNGTTRATNLTTQDGVLVKSGATTRRYLGTFYTTSTTATEDSEAQRLLFSYYHPVDKPLKAVDGTNSWTYTTASWRSANASTTAGVGRVAVMIGWAERPISVKATAFAANSTGNVSCPAGIGIDSTTANSAKLLAGGGDTGVAQENSAVYEGVLAVGYHYIQRLEYSTATGTTTWYGDNGDSSLMQTGLLGRIAV